MRTINPKPQSDEEEPGKVFWKRTGFWVVLLLLAAASVFYKDSWRDIWVGIQQITHRELLHCIALSLAAYFLEGMTIACMMSTVISSLPVKKGVTIAYLCEFYRLITLGNGSGFAEIYYLHKNGIETGTATVLTMLQYICKRIAIIVLGGAGFALLLCNAETRMLCRQYAGFMAAGCVISLAVIAGFLSIALSEKITDVILKAADWLALKKPSWKERLYVWKEQVVLLNQSGRSILAQKNKIAYAILLQIGKLLLFYAVPAYLLHGEVQAYEGLPGWIVSSLMMAVVYMLSGVIPVPSGVGSLEFVFLLFFSELGGVRAAIPAILVFRFVTWIIPFMAGGLLYLFRKNASLYDSRE